MTTSTRDRALTAAPLCEADTEGRKITFYLRDGFEDGTDGGGLPLGPHQERGNAHKVLDQAIDVIIGKRRSAVPVEKWVQVRYLAPEHEVNSRD